MTYILTSACLLGVCCKYSGGSNACPAVQELTKRKDVCLVPVCPEQMGGLPTPRVPAERIGDLVINRDGVDVTAQYRKGAEEAIRLANLYGCTAAVLKERSPSCGYGTIYDGTFSKTLVDGSGVAAEQISKMGLPVFGEHRINELIQFLDSIPESDKERNKDL